MSCYKLFLSCISIFLLALVLSTCKKNDPEPNPEPEPTITTYEQSCCYIPPLQGCINGAILYVPNAFTPNGDGINDIFKIHLGRGIEKATYFRVLNPDDGSVVHSVSEIMAANDLQIYGWDGTMPDGSIVQDVYLYELEAINIRGESMKFEGSVCLRLDTNLGIENCVDNEGNCTYSVQYDGVGEYCIGCPSYESCN